MSAHRPRRRPVEAAAVAPADPEAGFTVIEVIVAMALAVILIGALTNLFITGNNSALSAQRHSQLIAVADQQIEKIRQLVKTSSSGFAGLALSGAPAADPTLTANATFKSNGVAYLDPYHFVTAAGNCGPSSLGYAIETNYDNTAEGTLASVPAFTSCPSGVEPLLIKTGVTNTYGAPVVGFVSPGPTTVTVGSGTASVYTYVTATSLGCSSPGTADYVAGVAGACFGDARRVTVAVRLITTNDRSNIGPSTPVYVSTIVSNPVPSNQTSSSTGITLGLNIG
jgi:type II secretory pathway pseudopilin PulG